MPRSELLVFPRQTLFLALLALGHFYTIATYANEVSSEVTPTSVAIPTPPAELEEDILARALVPPVKTAEDILFEKAWKDAQKAPTEAFQKELAALQGYPLYDYLILAQMNTALKKNKADLGLKAQYKVFINKHQGEYLGERAAADFLLIAGKTLSPGEFNDIYNRLQWNKSEATLLVAYSALNPKKVSLKERFELYRDTSYRGEFLDDLGNTLKGHMTNWAWSEFLISIQKQRWQSARAQLSKVDKKMLFSSPVDVNSLIVNPNRWLKKHETLLAKNPRLALIAALRLAPSSGEQAAKLLETYGTKLSKDERNLGWVTVGYHGATDLSQDASQWYSQVAGNISDNKLLVQPDIKHAWAIRAALWSGRWKEVERLTRQLPASIANEEAWTYWRARALTELKQPDKAQPLFTKLSQQMTFYGKLADDMLNIGYFLPKTPTPVTLTEKDKAFWKNNPSIINAETFYRVEMYFQGHREWNWAMRGLSPDQVEQLAEYARTQALMHRMINTAQRVDEVNKNLNHLFPMPHRQEFGPISDSAGVPLAWVYGVIRQESRFMPAVTSSAGAQGLMQIMPRTARWLSKKLDIPLGSSTDLHDLNTNVQLGSSFLAMLRNDLADSMVLATAAYNAGPARAKKWRSLLARTTESAIFIENIPFNETREYVKNVMANTHTYNLLDGHTKLNFTYLISKIEPNNNTATDLP